MNKFAIAIGAALSTASILFAGPAAAASGGGHAAPAHVGGASPTPGIAPAVGAQTESNVQTSGLTNKAVNPLGSGGELPIAPVGSS